jgi:hypothetical protein
MAGAFDGGRSRFLGFKTTGTGSRQKRRRDQGFAWNYTSWLNLAFLAMAAVMVWRFLKTGGPAMLRHMEHAGGGQDHHAQRHHS